MHADFSVTPRSSRSHTRATRLTALHAQLHYCTRSDHYDITCTEVRGGSLFRGPLGYVEIFILFTPSSVCIQALFVILFTH
jgi:hypothetical protein